jgi:hypothetical protein
MTTDTKAVARWDWDLARQRMDTFDDGRYVRFTDHERVVGELREYHEGYREAATEETLRLRETLAASRAEVEGLKKDAERYRWLRDSKLSRHWSVANTCAVGRGHEFSYRGSPLDTAIDAAMEKGNV